MINIIKHCQANVIVTCHIDRLSRNIPELAILDKLINEEKILQIHTFDRAYKTKQDMIDLIQEVMDGIKYVRRMIIRVNEGIQTKLTKGEWLGNAPWRYINDLKTKTIKPDPEIVPYIKKAFNLYGSRIYTVKQIAEILFDDGLRSKIAKKKVHKSVIHRALINPVYYGGLPCKKEILKGSHQPIIAKELFDSVQDILNGKNRAKKQSLVFLFRDYLRCANCGCKLTASLKKKKYIYYYCTNGKGSCDQHKKYIPESELEKQISEIFRNIQLDQEWTDYLLNFIQIL